MSNGSNGGPFDPGEERGITEATGGVATLTRKDFTSDQEVRWCPGCGDYAVLAAVQSVMPQLGIPREKIVFISGIGCSSRFPYYMNSYGVHGIHGRAPAIATGVATARPDLHVWVVTGDGDGLSIGGNHLIHALRRNVNIKILLFNNQIYGLTKGQYSPTSERGKVTKSTPFGSLEQPFNPISVALGCEATFVARTMDVERKHLPEILKRAAAHRGSVFVEIYQNCNIFNDGAFAALTSKDGGTKNRIYLRHGEPVRFGPENEKGIRMRSDGALEIVDVAEVGVDNLLVHDENRDDPSLAFAMSRISEGPTMPTPLGIFRAVERPVYGEAMEKQLRAAAEQQGPGDLHQLLHAGDTWSVE
ncbi:MAG: 2-oxoacid:ferredoxin oxidoreductase subunit beta [Actinomycetota bacterium]|nr:2-oxoacid:ferredoxin oxidoreductase subunit beta [Actinomycetota bacterium]